MAAASSSTSHETTTTTTMEESPNNDHRRRSSVAEEPSSLDTSRLRPSIVGIGSTISTGISCDDYNEDDDHENNEDPQPRASEPNVSLATMDSTTRSSLCDGSSNALGSSALGYSSSGRFSTTSSSFRASTGIDTPEDVRVLAKELMAEDRQAKRASRRSVRQQQQQAVPNVVLQHESRLPGGLSKGLPADKFGNSSRTFEEEEAEDPAARTSVGSTVSTRSATTSASTSSEPKVAEAETSLPGAYALVGGRAPRHSSRRQPIDGEEKEEEEDERTASEADIDVSPPPLVEATLVSQVSERVLVTTTNNPSSHYTTADAFQDLEEQAPPTLRAVEVEEVELRDLLKNRRLQRFICCLVCVAMLFAAGIATVLVSKADSQDDPMWMGDDKMNYAGSGVNNTIQEDSTGMATEQPQLEEVQPSSEDDSISVAVVGIDDDGSGILDELLEAVQANVGEEEAMANDDDVDGTPEQVVEFLAMVLGGGGDEGTQDDDTVNQEEAGVDQHREYFRQVLIFGDKPTWNETTTPAFEALEVEYAERFIVDMVSARHDSALAIDPQILSSIIDDLNVECHVVSQTTEVVSLRDAFGQRGLNHKLKSQNHRHLPFFSMNVYISEVLFEMVWETPGIHAYKSPGKIMQDQSLQNMDGCVENLQEIFGLDLLSTTPPLLLVSEDEGGEGSVTSAYRQWLFPSFDFDPNATFVESVLQTYSERFLLENGTHIAESVGIEFNPEELETECSVLVLFEHEEPPGRRHRNLRASSSSLSPHWQTDRDLSRNRMIFLHYSIEWYTPIDQIEMGKMNVADSLSALPALFEAFLNDNLDSLSEDLARQTGSFPVRIVGPPPLQQPTNEDSQPQQSPSQAQPSYAFQTSEEGGTPNPSSYLSSATEEPSMMSSSSWSQTLVPSSQDTFASSV